MSSSDVNQSMATLFMPEQASPPIPVAGTTDACALYCDGTNLMLSVNGGAYAAIVTGSGASTLNATYANGPAGNTVLMTDALGPVTLSSARTTGAILAITTTTVPAAITGPIAAVSIDMSSLGTAGSAATTSLQAISITGPFSAVVKGPTTGLVRISSAYRNAQAINVVVKNKQALAGSVVHVGWDTTNYEGATANTTLTGATHVLTIDAQTNVTAGAFNVVGARVMLPASSALGTYGYVVSTTQTAGVLFYGHCNAPVSLTGALIGLYLELDDSTVTAGGAQLVGASIKTGTGTSIGDCGVNVECGARSASASCARFTMTANAASNANCIRAIMSDQVSSSAGVDGNILYGTIANAGGRGLRVQTTSFTGAFGGGLAILYRTGSWSGGGTESTPLSQVYRDVDIAATGTMSAPMLQITSISNTSGGTTTYSADDLKVERLVARSGGTLNISGSVLSVVHAPTGTVGTDTTSLITGTTISKSGTVAGFTSTGTLTGALTMLSLTASGATPGANAVVGASISIPASSSASAAGLVVTTAQTAGSAVLVHLTGASGATGGISVVGQKTTASGGTLLYAGSGSDTGGNVHDISGAYAVREGLVVRYGRFTATGSFTNPMFSINSITNFNSAGGQTLTLNQALLTIDHIPTQSGSGTFADTTIGALITMKPAVASAVVGVSVNMDANCLGAAITIAHSGTDANQIVFTSAADGAGAHIYGPTGSALVVRAGAPASSASGRGVTINASDANTSGDGGSVGLYPGAGAGGGGRGTLTLGGNVADILQFFGAGGSAKITVSGSRADPEEALANLLTALADYGLITNSTGA